DLTNDGGTLDIQSGTFNVAGNFTQTGTIQVAAGATFAKSGGFTNAGTMTGAGTIDVGGGVLLNNGVIQPGTSPGTLAINGNFTQGAAGALDVELAGTTQGVDYDLLEVSGVASL